MGCILKVDNLIEMHDKPQTFLTVVDKMTVHSLVIYGVAICVRSVEFTTGGIDVNKPNLRTHILFIGDLHLKDYVKYHMHKRHRSLFAQFRLTGRYDKTPVANIICKVCDYNALEDEFHFLMQCSRHTEFREVLYNKSSNLIENFFSYSDNETFVLLCKYSHKWP